MSSKKRKKAKNKVPLVDHTLPDENADHSGSDSANDKTNLEQIPAVEPRFDKPKRESNPDKTGIDTEADKTKKPI